jgi:heavy metal sensor kinase
VSTPARWWRSHSVRVRLTLWYIAAMLVVLAVYAAVVFAFVRRNLSAALDQQLRSDFSWAAAMVDQTPQGTITFYQGDEEFGDQELPWLQVWTPDGAQLLYSNFEAQRRPVPGTRRLAARADNDQIVSVPATPVPVRVLSRRGRIGPRRVVIQVARSEQTMRDQLRRLVLFLVLGLPLAVAVAGLGAYALARRALAPIERMTDRAQHITAERLTDRLPVANPDDEIGRLATVFNRTLARLQESFDQMRRFTADVSHELRTPLTAIRSVGEVGLRGYRDETAYRGIIGSMLEEADRLASLVDRLLTLSRSETGQSALSREPVDLHALAADVVGHLGVLAEEKQQSVVLEPHGGIEALADREVLRQAFINLLDNAIKFSPVGGEIRIRLSETAADAIVDVSDSGEGVSDEARARIFDRFYRADGRTTVGGSGLGLSIAKGAVEANGGHLSIETSGPSGTTFRITIPRAPAAPRRAAV